MLSEFARAVHLVLPSSSKETRMNNDVRSFMLLPNESFILLNPKFKDKQFISIISVATGYGLDDKGV